MAPQAQKKILVVEDHEGIRENICDFLKLEGFLCMCAADGQEAMDSLYKGLIPDLILLDLMMPVKSGAQVVAELQMNPLFQTLPVIVMSADPRGLLSVSAVAHLKKPLNLVEILSAINKVLKL